MRTSLSWPTLLCFLQASLKSKDPAQSALVGERVSARFSSDYAEMVRGPTLRDLILNPTLQL